VTEVDELLCYRYSFMLPHEVKASLIFDSMSSSHTINYEYSHVELDNDAPVYTVKQKVHVNYKKGELTELINVSYEVFNHSKAGKQFFLGVDISKDHHVFIDIDYKRTADGKYSISEIRKGISVIYSEGGSGADLMSLVVSPLNIATVLSAPGYSVKVPICRVEGEPAFIEISVNNLR